MEQHKGEFVILERSHFGDQDERAAVGIGDIGRYANFATDNDYTPAHLLKMQPTKRTTGHDYLICGQVPGDKSVVGLNMGQLYDQSVREIKEADPHAEIYFRPHPIARNVGVRGTYLLNSHVPLENQLEGKRGVVAISSKALTDAYIAGYKVWALNDRAMTWDVSHTSGKNLVAGHRPITEKVAGWSSWISQTSWTQAELAAGTVWERLKHELV